MSKLNVGNRTVFIHDNLDVLRGINSNSIDLIYLDPPFNKKKQFSAPIGSVAEGASFNDTFRQKDIKEEWFHKIEKINPALYELLDFSKKAEGRTSYNFCYLAYMAIRLIEMHRILKSDGGGGIYLHCDPTMSHYLKLALDCIFGRDNFKSEIIWRRKKGTSTANVLSSCYDSIFFYVKSEDFTYNIQYVDYSEEYVKKTYNKKDEKGLYRIHDLVASPNLGGNSPRYEYKGFIPKTRWLVKEETLLELEKEGRIVFSKNGRPYRKLYLHERKGAPLQNLWIDIDNVQSSKEKQNYPTQKPVKLLRRIIKASSNPGDIVLDPFCGCATTCVAAEFEGRKWIGIDVSLIAGKLVKNRLVEEIEDLFINVERDITFKTYPPKRTDINGDVETGDFVYLISNKAFPDFYKVGITGRTLESRLSPYQTGDPFRAYKIIYSVETPKYVELEKMILEKYRYGNTGEWVQGNLEEIKYDMDEFNTQLLNT